ncbi:MAG TPA: winged helix-turn-helix domain-containing protein [Flavisolibacter sp.]|nr:winged helix-turn-helix domain-containing protein [Flavisolibacter sp.]
MQSEVRKFSGWDVRRLKAAISAVRDKRTYIRLEAVLAVALNEPVAALSMRLHKNRRSIYRWCETYLESHDPNRLHDAPRSGRPLACRVITEKHILHALDQSPRALGYRAGGWTVALLAQYLVKRYQCTIAQHTLRRRMKEMGLRYKRPRYVYEEKDPSRVQKKGRLPES